MTNSLFWAEWVALIATVTMVVILVMNAWKHGVDHAFTHFSGIVALVTGGCYFMIVVGTGMAEHSRVLNPERFAKVMQQSVPATCGPVAILPEVDRG